MHFHAHSSWNHTMIFKILCVRILIYHTAWAISVAMELDSNEVVYISSLIKCLQLVLLECIPPKGKTWPYCTHDSWVLVVMDASMLIVILFSLLVSITVGAKLLITCGEWTWEFVLLGPYFACVATSMTITY